MKVALQRQEELPSFPSVFWLSGQGEQIFDPTSFVNFPLSHDVQDVAAIPLKEPTAQSRQVELSEEAYFPSTHGMQ
jgi:hypothetical protein